jgi:hypothetical protein
MTGKLKVLSVLILVAVGAAGCKQDDAEKQKAAAKTAPGTDTSWALPAADKLTREIVPFDPSSGVTQRINKRDALNRLREVEISFTNKSRGLIWKNDAGRNTRAKMLLPDGTSFEGSIPDGGSVPTPITATGQGGRPLAELVSHGTAGHSLRLFDKEGKLRFTEKRDGEHKVQTLYTGDKPVFEMEFDAGVRRSLRMYSNGVRIYEEIGGEQFDVQRR